MAGAAAETLAFCPRLPGSAKGGKLPKHGGPVNPLSYGGILSNPTAEAPTTTQTLSVAETCAALGITRRTLSAWRDSGRLVPSTRKGRRVYYDAADVERCQHKRTRDGRTAAKLFAFFEGGGTAVQSVIELEVTPHEAERAHAAYCRMSGSWRIEGPSGPRAHWERVYQVGELTPAKLRLALELCGADPKLRRRLTEAT